MASLFPGFGVWSDGAVLITNDLGSVRDSWAANQLRPDGDKQVARAKTGGEWGSVNSTVTLRDRDELLDPARPSSWETDETVRVPVAGALFVYGSLTSSSPSVEQQQLRWLGKTGVGVKLKPWLFQEVQVRGGPAVRYDDTSLSPGQSPERSELFLEAATKVPLPGVGPVNVEYAGYAVPAVTPTDRGQFNQDLRLAKPLGGGNEFHLGAKYRSEDAATPTPWVDRMQLYMGVQLKR